MLTTDRRRPRTLSGSRPGPTSIHKRCDQGRLDNCSNQPALFSRGCLAWNPDIGSTWQFNLYPSIVSFIKIVKAKISPGLSTQYWPIMHPMVQEITRLWYRDQQADGIPTAFMDRLIAEMGLM